MIVMWPKLGLVQYFNFQKQNRSEVTNKHPTRCTSYLHEKQCSMYGSTKTVPRLWSHSPCILHCFDDWSKGVKLLTYLYHSIFSFLRIQKHTRAGPDVTLDSLWTEISHLMKKYMFIDANDSMDLKHSVRLCFYKLHNRQLWGTFVERIK